MKRCLLFIQVRKSSITAESPRVRPNQSLRCSGLTPWPSLRREVAREVPKWTVHKEMRKSHWIRAPPASEKLQLGPPPPKIALRNN